MLLNRLNGKCQAKEGKSAVWGFLKVLLWTAVLAGLALSIVLNFNFFEKLESRDQKLKAEGVWSKCLLSAEQNEYETAIKTADEIIKEFPVLARKEGVGFYKDQWGRKLAARQGWRKVKQSADGGKYEEALSLAKAFFDKYPDSEFVADAKRQSAQWENKISVGKRIKELLEKPKMPGPTMPNLSSRLKPWLPGMKTKTTGKVPVLYGKCWWVWMVTRGGQRQGAVSVFTIHTG